MPQRASWRGLGIGVTGIFAIIAIALWILIYGRVGRLPGNKISLYVSAASARGLIRGSEVWLDGQRVGTVTNIEFRAVSTAASERLLITVRVLADTRDRIRTDSRVQIRPGVSPIGDRVVSINSGTRNRPAVHAGDTLHATTQHDRETVASDFALASREFPDIVANLKLLAGQLESIEGTVGALRLDDGRLDWRAVRDRSQRLVARLSNSEGTFQLMRDSADVLRARVERALSQVDSVRTLLSSDQHSLGRFRRDSTLGQQIAGIREELAEAQRLVADTSGSIGRLRADSAIVLALRRSATALDSLMADIKKRPLRYIVF